MRIDCLGVVMEEIRTVYDPKRADGIEGHLHVICPDCLTSVRVEVGEGRTLVGECFGCGALITERLHRDIRRIPGQVVVVGHVNHPVEYDEDGICRIIKGGE